MAATILTQPESSPATQPVVEPCGRCEQAPGLTRDRYYGRVCADCREFLRAEQVHLETLAEW